MPNLVAIEILHAEMGTVSSRADHSASFRIITPELRPSEAGALMSYHGKACHVLIKPHDEVPDEQVSVDTQRETKTPSQRLRAVMFVDWTQKGKKGSFDAWYAEKMEIIINKIKSTLEPE
jgi:hypothetical protein